MAIKQNVIDDYNLLTGQQKAAILMLSMDEDRSSAIFSMMDDEEIKELSVTMASLGKVNSNVIEELINEFNEKISDTGNLVGTYESTERLLAKALDKDRVSVIMEEIRGPFNISTLLFAIFRLLSFISWSHFNTFFCKSNSLRSYLLSF